LGDGRSPEAFDWFERLTALPMFVLAIAAVPLLLAPVFWDRSPGVEDTIFALDAFIWAAFALEYAIRLEIGSPSRRAGERSERS
jgi:hypothetical protein